ncbi:patatin-like phospholipase family protein [Poseidonibacter lekithochrous]|uniref:patatin-like phospholipase family protein n=1 Tax=Poseidonibacter lekithochrous TaxID=1904463 RepID=UPI0009F8E554|nr:patatin-like phospholipase family protein [Poseidonibacter lekithochrous]QKJ23559.1 Patatin-like phospholipase [Poseidonibacter lekithochrous]
MTDKKYSLVLSGGGALGIAHIGVIEDLENKYKNKPSEIIGTSMGGIVAACLSIGMSCNEIYKLIEEFSKIRKWIKLSFDGNSIIKTKKLEKIFFDIFGNKKIKDTLIPLKIITTKLKNGKVKVFSKKDDVKIVDALLATMAIPGIFQEKLINDEIYLDGFLSDNLGIRFAKHKNIIAIDVLGKKAYDKTLPNNFIKTNNVIEMFEKSMKLLIINQTLKNKNLLKNKKLTIIEPNTKEYKTYQFHKYDELYKLGKGLIT